MFSQGWAMIGARLKEIGMLVGFLASLSSPAMADWQFTRWAMTQSQVEAASGGKTQPNDDRGKDPDPMVAALKMDHAASGLDFLAYFIFDGDKGLARVTLEPKDNGRCKEVRYALTSAYGRPQDTSTDAITDLAKWWSEATGNIVVYLQIGPGCSVDYTPLNKPGAATGL